MQPEILPLAITMMAGPQILVAIIFITSKKDVIKVSVSYLAGIAIAGSVFITTVFIIARLLGITADAAGHAPKKVSVIEVILVSLLIFASLRSYLNRTTAKPPKWMAKLQETKPSGAFKLGLLLICLMPGDFVVMITVGLHLAGHGSSPAALLNAVPFLVVVMLIASAPLLGYLAFRRQAQSIMPKVRNWIQDNSWLVNIAVYLVFIYLLVT
jgi:hypothetical protein